MVERRDLIEKGKSAGESVAGTLKSAAGTLKSTAGTVGSKAKAGASKAASATRRGVRESYNELTDDNVTDQEQARLERARQEAREEARAEARQEFREEYRENIADEAYDMELQRLRRRNQQVDNATQPRRPSGLGLFGGTPQPQQPQATDDGNNGDARRQPRRPAASLFGMPAGRQRRAQEQSEQRADPVASLFGMGQQTQDTDDDTRPPSPFGLF